MPTTRSPRHGSMQFWPRKRAKRAQARIRSWPQSQKAQPVGFAGYKVGMTTCIVPDNRKVGKSKGDDIAFPVTVIECPPVKVLGMRLYKKDGYGLKVAGQFMAKGDKELARRLRLPKQDIKMEDVNPADYSDIRLLVYTQPSKTNIGKKKPEVFELGLGGNNEEKFNYAKEKLGKEIMLSEVFEEGQQVDTHAITKGKGFQGPVKRFGVGLRSHKSEKVKRGPGSLGGWKAQGHFMYRIAHAGQMGYHTRSELNKWIVKISDKPEEINPKGGFLKYGDVKNQYILLKGSTQGTTKRLVKFVQAMRPNKKISKETPNLKYISLESKQGK